MTDYEFKLGKAPIRRIFVEGVKSALSTQPAKVKDAFSKKKDIRVTAGALEKLDAHLTDKLNECGNFAHDLINLVGKKGVGQYELDFAIKRGCGISKKPLLRKP